MTVTNVDLWFVSVNFPIMDMDAITCLLGNILLLWSRICVCNFINDPFVFNLLA